MNLRRHEFESKRQERYKERLRQAKSMQKKPTTGNIADMNKYIKNEKYKKERKMGGVIKRGRVNGVMKKTEMVGSNIQTTPSIVKPLPPSCPTPEEITQRCKIEKDNGNRVCIINQDGNVSDIIFFEPIARMYHEFGYKVVWPISFDCSLNKHFPHITFIPRHLLQIPEHRDFHNTSETLIIPLKWATDILKNPQKSKYSLWNLPVETWRTTKWERDEKAELELYNMLELEEGRYNLISDNLDYNKITPDNNLKNIRLQTISDFSLLDWGFIIEKATNIYVAAGPICFLIELLNTQATYHLYFHPNKPSYINLLKKPYILHKD